MDYSATQHNLQSVNKYRYPLVSLNHYTHILVHIQDIAGHPHTEEDITLGLTIAEQQSIIVGLFTATGDVHPIYGKTPSFLLFLFIFNEFGYSFQI